MLERCQTKLSLSLVLLNFFYMELVDASYFVDIPSMKLFTPPDNYIFAVQLIQRLSFDVTGDFAIENEKIHRYDSYHALDVLSAQDADPQRDVDIVFRESVDLIVPDPACSAIPIRNRTWCPLGNTTFCSCLVWLLLMMLFCLDTHCDSRNFVCRLLTCLTITVEQGLCL